MKRRIQTGGFLKPCTHVYLATILYVRREKILGKNIFEMDFEMKRSVSKFV